MPTPETMTQKAQDLFGASDIDVNTAAINIQLTMALLATCVVIFCYRSNSYACSSTFNWLNTIILWNYRS
ncbi:MAG: hypothetical protein ACJZ14_03925 [Candidatus Neomarinimicrobiota bacterium]